MHKLWILFVFLQSTLAFGSTFVPVSIKKQIKEADGLVYGKVINSSAVAIEHGEIATKVFLRLDKWIDVEPSNNHLEVYYPGGVLGDRATRVEGTPTFKLGEDVVLFIGKDQKGRSWVRNLGVGKYSEKSIGKKKILVNQMYPFHPQMGQMPSSYFFQLAERVKNKKFKERFKDKYEIQQAKKKRTVSASLGVGRAVASTGSNVPAEKESNFSVFWLLTILGLMGGVAAFKNKRHQ
jgi:hypothetical protein